MLNFQSLLGNAARDLDSSQLMEQRIGQLEALVHELRLELEELRRHVTPDTQRRADKMQRYQHQLDLMFGLRESA